MIRLESAIGTIRNARSNPSSTRSTIRVDKVMSSETSGYCAVKSTIAGAISSGTIGAALSRNVPRGFDCSSWAACSALSISARMRVQLS
jgi:hypothetical protein